MLMTYKIIHNQQQAWAHQREIKFDKDGYTFSLDDNLLFSLLPEVKKEFQSGKGDELGSDEKRGKMQALHSSAALVVNVFQYWVNRNVSDIALACGAPQGMTELHFEITHPTPLGGVPPHLDLEFWGNKLKPLAIESKFTELYYRHTKRTIKTKYLSVPGLWAQLPRCEKLVRHIHEEEQGKTSFVYLDAPQLLKHILGLATKFGPKGFQILYLWYEIPSIEAEKHRSEIVVFKEYVGDEVDFRDMTYQELFKAINKLSSKDRDYVSYLHDRYFPSLTD